MIFVMFFACGLAIGGAMSIIWWSADVLLGTHTITAGKVVAMIGLSAVGTAVFTSALMAIDEFRSGGSR